LSYDHHRNSFVGYSSPSRGREETGRVSGTPLAGRRFATERRNRKAPVAGCSSGPLDKDTRRDMSCSLRLPSTTG